MKYAENTISATPSNLELRGYCSKCDKEHRLTVGNARKHCLDLMATLERHKRLDFMSDISSNTHFSTSTLFGPARGKMFGILEGIDATGKSVLLQAFSGQFNGFWDIPGWVPPIFGTTDWHALNDPAERQIKRLTQLLNDNTNKVAERQFLRRSRKRLSQQLMTRLHALYILNNFRGQSAALASFYGDRRGIPTGAGDCCAPKLLHHALKNSITPVGLAEFYWGRTNKSVTHKHGRFYPACMEKCKPLMGFLLCGLEEKQQKLRWGDETVLP